MKVLLVALSLVAGQALACPGDKTKDAMAPATSKHGAQATATTRAPAATVASTKAVTKVVATKASTAGEARKASSL
jgi:hypothetical protein